MKKFVPRREVASAMTMDPAAARALIQTTARRVEQLKARRRKQQRALDVLDDEIRAAKRELRDVMNAAIPDADV